MIDFPLPTEGDGSNGRGPHGRFGKGNRYGRGNPHAKKAAAWRRALDQSITAADVKAVTRKLVELARAGEPWAVREFYARTQGTPVAADALQRIEELEAQVLEVQRQ